MQNQAQTYRIRIANDHEQAAEFVAWLRVRGHDAELSGDTGDYVDDRWTSDSDEASDLLRQLWDEYCGQTPADVAAGILAATPAQVVACLGDLTQVQVAALLGVAQSSVSDWINGKTEMSRPARRLALAHLGVLPTADGGWRAV